MGLSLLPGMGCLSGGASSLAVRGRGQESKTQWTKWQGAAESALQQRFLAEPTALATLEYLPSGVRQQGLQELLGSQGP